MHVPSPFIMSKVLKVRWVCSDYNAMERRIQKMTSGNREAGIHVQLMLGTIVIGFPTERNVRGGHHLNNRQEGVSTRYGVHHPRIHLRHKRTSRGLDLDRQHHSCRSLVTPVDDYDRWAMRLAPNGGTTFTRRSQLNQRWCIPTGAPQPRRKKNIADHPPHRRAETGKGVNIATGGLSLPGSLPPNASASHVTRHAKPLKTSWGIVFFFFRVIREGGGIGKDGRRGVRGKNMRM